MSEQIAYEERRAEAIRSARTSSAWIDRSDMGVVTLSGTDRIDLLQRLTTNDFTGIGAGKGIQTVALTEKARIIDVITVLDSGDSATLLTSPGTADDVVSWLRKYIIMDDAKAKRTDDGMVFIEVMGPRSAEVVNQLTELDVADWAKFQWAKTTHQDPLLVVRMPSPCDVSYIIGGSAEHMSGLTTALQQNAEALRELNANEWEYLRIVGGFGKMQHEWGEKYNPLEAGLLHLTSFTKGCYIGQEVVARLDSYNKVKQRVMGLIGETEFAIGDEVIADDKVIGVVTSVTTSLDGSKTVGLGYVRGEHAHENTNLTLRSGEATTTVTQVIPPIEL